MKIVLYSGGLDSTVVLAAVVKEFGAENVKALNIFYGQKHHKEQEYAEYQCNKYGVELINLDLSGAFKFDTSCTLLKGNAEIPKLSYGSLATEEGAVVNTYVPFRNGLFLSYAAAIALQLKADMIFYGAHKNDGINAYPDCTEIFADTMGAAIKLGTGGAVTLATPYKTKTKTDIVQDGKSLGVEFDKTWSCYEGQEVPCNECATCIERNEALSNNNLI